MELVPKTLQNPKLLYEKIAASIFKNYFANLSSELDIRLQKTYQSDPDPVFQYHPYIWKPS